MTVRSYSILLALNFHCISMHLLGLAACHGASAFSLVYPNASHLLCRWHVDRYGRTLCMYLTVQGCPGHASVGFHLLWNKGIGNTAGATPSNMVRGDQPWSALDIKHKQVWPAKLLTGHHLHTLWQQAVQSPHGGIHLAHARQPVVTIGTSMT